MDSHDVAEQYDIEIAETKIKTNKEFIGQLNIIKKQAMQHGITNYNDYHNYPYIDELIKKYDYKIKEAQKELIQLKTESRFYGKDF